MIASPAESGRSRATRFRHWPTCSRSICSGNRSNQTGSSCAAGEEDLALVVVDRLGTDHALAHVAPATEVRPAVRYLRTCRWRHFICCTRLTAELIEIAHELTTFTSVIRETSA